MLFRSPSHSENAITTGSVAANSGDGVGVVVRGGDLRYIYKTERAHQGVVQETPSEERSRKGAPSPHVIGGERRPSTCAGLPHAS